MRSNLQPSLFEGHRFTLKESMQLSLDSLREYGQRYHHWCVAYSGGKDSSSTVTFIAWAILTGQIDPPDRWGLEAILDIQNRVNAAANGRPLIDLVNAEEESRIKELWSLNTWPNGWSGDEVVGSVPIDSRRVTDAGDIVTQRLLVR
jgi:hypothetical protein